MGNENKKTQSMVSAPNSRHNSPRGSGEFPSQASAPQQPSQQLPMSPSFDQLPQFMSQSPMLSSPTPPPMSPSPLPASFNAASFMTPSPTFGPLTLPNSGFLTTPMTNNLSLPFAYPPIKLPPTPHLYRFTKYDGLFDDYEFGMGRFRPRPFYCPNYCPPRDCHCPQLPPARPHSSNNHRSHHSTHHSTSHHNDKRHERRSVDHHSSKHHHSQSSQQPMRVICRNA